MLLSRNTNVAGEVHELLSEQDFSPGVYRVEFDTKTYWKAEGHKSFHEVAQVSSYLVLKKKKKKPLLEMLINKVFTVVARRLIIPSPG